MPIDITDPGYPGFELPVVMNPPDYLCFTVKVPNDRGHIGAFLGSLFDLTQWINWQRDPAKRGKDAAAVWRAIWTDLQAQSCNLPIAPRGAEIEDFMPLRVDCDCNVFVTCCDGTEKQILTSDQVKALIAGGTVPGAPQPPSGGGQQCYQLKLNAAQPQLVPTPVSTGDVIELQSALGAGNDGTVTWYCPNGQEFFAGACVGTPFTQGGDPLPTAPHMSILVKLGSNYYQLVVGTPFTVPGGVSNVQPILQVNDAPLTDDSGDYSLNVCVTNNSAATFSHTFNFITTDGGFVPLPSGGSAPLGSWSAGNGWLPTDAFVSPDNFRVMYLQRTFAARTITGVTATYNYSPGTFLSPTTAYGMLVALSTLGGTREIDLVASALGAGGSPVISHGNVIIAGATGIELYLSSCDSTSPSDGSCTLLSLTITGQGTDPF